MRRRFNPTLEIIADQMVMRALLTVLKDQPGLLAAVRASVASGLGNDQLMVAPDVGPGVSAHEAASLAVAMLDEVMGGKSPTHQPPH